MRLAIGDVYKVRGYLHPDSRDYLDFTFEICGEVFVDGERFAIGVKHREHPTNGGSVVVFNSDGYGETCGGDFRWQAWETSRAKPQFICKSS